MILGWLLIAILILPVFTLLETMLWWAFWSIESHQINPNPPQTWHTTVIFLTGTSNYARSSLDPEQIRLLKRVQTILHPDFVVASPFPYTQFTAFRWKRFSPWFIWHSSPPLIVISLHNLWQTVLVLIAPRRYGQDIARCLINTLPPQSFARPRLIFICGSAGAALALGAAKHLHEVLHAEINIIAYGGFFHGYGLQHIQQFFSLEGDNDMWISIADWFFNSRSRGQFKRISTGPHMHHGNKGYLGSHVFVEGKTAEDMTIESVEIACKELISQYPDFRIT